MASFSVRRQLNLHLFKYLVFRSLDKCEQMGVESALTFAYLKDWLLDKKLHPISLMHFQNYITLKA